MRRIATLLVVVVQCGCAHRSAVVDSRFLPSSPITITDVDYPGVVPKAVRISFQDAAGDSFEYVRLVEKDGAMPAGSRWLYRFYPESPGSSCLIVQIKPGSAYADALTQAFEQRQRSVCASLPLLTPTFRAQLIADMEMLTLNDLRNVE
jgi:hypothetical protein